MTVTVSSSQGESLIRLRSLQKPDNVRGFTIHGVVIDEAAYTSAEAWREVIRPTLMDTKGWTLKITTPAGYNHIYDEFVSQQPNLSTWRIPSYGVKLEGEKLVRQSHDYENPALDMEEMDSLLLTMDSLSFRQEILAEFISDNLCPFSNIDELCVLPTRKGSKVKTVAGIDFAKSVDYTAISIMNPETKEELALIRLPHSQYKEQIERIYGICKQYNVEMINFDATGVGDAVGEMMYERLSSLGIGMQAFKFTNQSKIDLVYGLVFGMEKRELRLTDSDIGIYELRKFRRVNRGNTIKFENEQDTDHDDTVIARCLAWEVAMHRGIML
jgi:hypothetical protein